MGHYPPIRILQTISPIGGKINIIPLRQLFKMETKVGYYEGEDDVDRVWKELK